jgi:hypothetical protein
MFAASKTARKAAASTGDPYWSSVSLLTNFENNLSFQDGSSNNLALTRTGTVNPSLNTPFGGGVGGSFSFVTSGNSLKATSSTLSLSGSDFTIEGWIYLTGYSPSYSGFYESALCGSYNGGTSGFEFAITGTASSYTGINFQAKTSNVSQININQAQSFSLNTWYHIAVIRSGTSFRIFVNGALINTTTSSAAWTDSGVLDVGQIGATGFQYTTQGNISNFRVVKGTALYTANFTPPTAPLTAISGTSLLITGTGQGMFNNSTFVDQGPNALALTASNTFPVYAGSSPFGNSYPGSLFFTGGQRFRLATSTSLQFDAGDFTIEFWMKAGSSQVTYAIITDGSTNNSATNIGVGVNNGGTAGKLCFNVQGSTLPMVSTTTVLDNTWRHIACVRSGSNAYLFVNGVLEASRIGTITFTAAYLNGGCFGGSAFGTGTSSDNYFTGSISNFRVVKGTALYTSNFTPSTTPLTAVTNTSLLIRGDTGAFYDLSNNGNPESNTGTTAVTTQIKKYGNESASYTATAYQTVNDAVNLQLGTGDYTIEMWVYRNAAGVLHSLICKGAAATGWLLQVNSSNQLVFTVTSTAILTSTTTIAATTWTFVTVTRSGSSTRLFVGGNLEATATDSTNFNQTNALLVGCDRSNLNGLNGYLDDIRITKGVARYTASFTPPTQTFPTGP